MDRFDRQRRIFGDEGQKLLRQTSVGVVGCGGLGSFTVLELAYLGVGEILLIDEDSLNDPDRNRLVGAWSTHREGTPKVEILRELAKRIDPAVAVEVQPALLETREARADLTKMDVVMGCVDHDGPRFLLNEFCCKHGLPLIDAASDTLPERDQVLFGGRVCVATELTGCLFCFGVLDQNEIREYFASEELKTDLELIYGIPVGALTGSGPSVVTVNGVVASMAVTELMALVTGVRTPIPHQDWHGHEGRLSRVVDREEDCYYCGLRPESKNQADKSQRLHAVDLVQRESRGH